jgi:signal transduction histidine kinase
MGVSPSRTSRVRAERAIAAARVVLGISSLFAVWMDPAEPAHFVQLTYALHAMYVAYSLAVAAYVWRVAPGGVLPIATHAADIVAFSVFQYLTLGPSSPFFVYFVFSLFGGALRWGWRGTLATAAAVLPAFVVMGASMSRTPGASEFELNRFIIRIVYLAVAAGLLVHLGRYEAQLRHELERLARWPAVTADNVQTLTEPLIAHAAGIVGARRAVIVWEAGEEPFTQVASWSAEGFSITRHAPDEFDPLVAPDAGRATFLINGPIGEAAQALVTDGEGRGADTRPVPVHARFMARLTGTGLVSAAFTTDRVSGRAFFSDLGEPSGEVVPLTEVVARELGASLDQLHVTRHLTDIATREERIRVARDLHDGILQSLTGIRFEIRAIAAAADASAPSARDRLFAIERALAIEQRELRFFIGGLKPTVGGTEAETTLASRLDSLRERIALEWKVPVTIRVPDDELKVTERVEQAMPPMIHEAIVNALKHGQPSRVTVTLDHGPAGVRIVVADDGRGFPFRGRYDHHQLQRNGAGPASLFERVCALGGEMAIESSDAGSRVEMQFPSARA